jgi:large subunit ribosomal protein L23
MLIQKPVLTRKSQLLHQKNNIYTFYVQPSLNKFQIRAAIESMFRDSKIKVKKLRTSRQRPVLQKTRYLQKFPGKIYTPMRKKVFVQLVSGQNLPNFFGE